MRANDSAKREIQFKIKPSQLHDDSISCQTVMHYYCNIILNYQSNCEFPIILLIELQIAVMALKLDVDIL